MLQKRLFVFVLFSLALFTTLPVFGSTVTNTSDSGPGSLRDAIASAAPGDTIDFRLKYPATITLSSTLAINQNLTISGPGASNLVISGNNAVGVFFIGSRMTVSISGVTIENGSFFYGGGIASYGTLTLTNSTVSGNSGGGIFNVIGTLTVSNSTVSGNSGSRGGGIYNETGTLTLSNSTVSGNSATYGGGIYNETGTLTLSNSTVSGNSATYFGGGILSLGTLTLKSTIVANSGFGGNCYGAGGTDGGHNLSDDNSCSSFLTSGTNWNNTPAGLDPNGLQDNGGPTKTIALLSTSPAVDVIPVANCTDVNGNPVTTDQRGVTRPQGPACDIGAFELVPFLVPTNKDQCKADGWGTLYRADGSPFKNEGDCIQYFNTGK